MKTLIKYNLLADIFPNNLTLMMPGDDDDPEDGEGDWTDIDDEDFEDMAGDDDDLSEIKEDNNVLDSSNDDHLPDEDF